MEAMAVLWTPFDEPIPWALPQVPYVTISTTDGWTSQLSFSVSGVPSNPNIESCIGCAAPSVQTVVTLNLTSYSNLTYLLAGLLDNNTTLSNGELGVNGYFVDVTNQIPTLGLNPVVLSVLANSSQPDSGVFGASCSVCVPTLPGAAAFLALRLHPHDLFAFFAGLWNSFSGVIAALVTHLAALVHALVGLAWDAFLAAAAYFNHIREGLAHVAMVFVQASVHFLGEVGHALEAALQALLAFVLNAIETLLKPIVSAITNSMGTYISSLWTDFGPLWSDQNKSKTPSPSQVFPLIDNLLGQTPIFVALGLGVLVEIAFGVASVLVPGTSFVEDALETVVIGTILSSFIGFLSSLIPSIFMSPGVISAAWHYYNVTGGGSHPSMVFQGSSPVCGSIIATLLTAFGVTLASYQFYGDMTGARYMLDLLVTARTTPGAEIAMLPTLSFVMDAISLLIALHTLPPPIGIIQGGMAHVMNIIGLLLGTAGLVIGGYALLFKRPALAEPPGLLDTTITGEALGAIGTTANLIQVAAGC